MKKYFYLLSVIFISACTMGSDYVRPEQPSAATYTSENDLNQFGSQKISSTKTIPEKWWQEFQSPALNAVVERGLTHSYYLASMNKEPKKSIFMTGVQKQASSDYQAYSYDAAYLTVAGKIVTTAFLIASLNAQLDAVKEIVNEDKKNLQLINKAIDLGSATQKDLIAAQQQLTSDEILLPSLNLALSQAKNELNAIVGLTPTEWTPPNFQLKNFTLPKDLPLGAPSALVRNRSDLLAAEAVLRATNPDKDAYANYQNMVLKSFVDVNDVLQALKDDEYADQLGKETLVTAKKSLDLAQKSQSLGGMSNLEVLVTQRRYMQAKLAYAKIQGQRYVDTAQLYIALGGQTTPVL